MISQTGCEPARDISDPGRADRAVIPPPVPGTITPRPRNAWALVWWAEKGFALAAQDARLPRRSRVYYALLTVLWWPLVPVTVSWQLVALTRRTTRYYMTAERDAVLAVHSHAGTWHLEDHICAAPGTGRGKALRAIVLPQLLQAADRAGVAIEATAVSDNLAATYQAELPGMQDHGHGLLRGRKLRRDPGSPRSPQA